MIYFWLFSWTNAAVVAPTHPGKEYTIDGNLFHYTIDSNLHHYTVDEEDG